MKIKKGFSRGKVTSTCEKELELAPETGFILSMFKNIAACRMGNTAAGKIRFTGVVALHNCRKLSRHLTVDRFRVLNFHGFLKKKKKTLPVSLQSRLSVTLPSAFSVSLRESCNAMMFVRNSRMSSQCSGVVQSAMDFGNELGSSFFSFDRDFISS